MDENRRYAVGLDVGTDNVRAVVATVSSDGKLAVVGYNEGKNAGMRKGAVANLAGPAESIDRMLGEVERMSGYEIDAATVSINGDSIRAMQTEGMIAAGTIEHEINENDLSRVEDVAVMGKVSANRAVLDVVPLEYALDGQRGIKDPIGMTGARLEMRACVISALLPNYENLKKATEGAKVHAERIVPGVVAAAKAVLTEKQMENGVVVVDLGAATTSVAVYFEGDLQYVGVVPEGSNNITNDLAIVLAITPEMAEEIKQRFVSGDFESEKTPIIRVGKEERAFERAEVEKVAKDRLKEIFGEVRKKLKLAKYDQRLPEGVVLVGGGAKMKGIEVFAQKALETSVRIGIPRGVEGVSEGVLKPEYAVAVGLMMLAAERVEMAPAQGGKHRKSGKVQKHKGKGGGGLLKRMMSKF